jgi:hypothetical protein
MLATLKTVAAVVLSSCLARAEREHKAGRTAPQEEVFRRARRLLERKLTERALTRPSPP